MEFMYPPVLIACQVELSQATRVSLVVGLRSMCDAHCSSAITSHLWILTILSTSKDIYCGFPSPAVKHIMSECADLYDLRERFLGKMEMKDILTDIPTANLFGFIKETDLFYKI